MELRHIRYFIAVAEELNFSRAAARLFIAQPPLSVQIQDLEKDLGVKLFDRSGRGTTLTREGEVFLREARQINDHVDRARMVVNQASSGERGRIRVSGIPTAFIETLPATIPRFQQEYPGVVLDLREAGSQQSLDLLQAGDVDVAFLRQGDPVAGLEILPLRTARFEVAVPVNHPLATRSTIAICDLAAEPFVMSSRRTSPYYYDQTLAVLAAAGVTPRTVIEASSIQAQLGYVGCGMGVALVPAARTGQASAHVARCELDQHIDSTELAVAWAAGPTPLVVDHFLKIVLEEVADDRADAEPARSWSPAAEAVDLKRP